MNYTIRKGIPTINPDRLREEAFLSNVVHKIGHEIGNPLTSIISLATVLSRFINEKPEALDNTRLEFYTQSISSEAWRITSITEKLVLLYSDKRPALSSVSLQDTLSKAASKISKKYAKIEIKPAPTKTGEKTYFVASEPDLLQWVLSALIENILHASESKEGILDLEYFVVEQEERLFLELRNSLDTKICCELSELFMPFVSYSKEKRTLGLGLTVAHAILTRLNASIELEEQELKDSFCFVARLNLPKAVVKSAQQLPPGASSNLRSQQLQILLIEDEESVSTAIKKVLDYVFRESSNYQCLIMNGAEAKRYIEAGERFDLIICDYNLESCKGDQILRLVERCCPENRDKFILCSGDRFSEAEKQSINCPILAKPFEMDEFLSLIFKILNT